LKRFVRNFSQSKPMMPFFLQPATLDLVKDCAELVTVIRETLGKITPVAVVLETLNRSLAGSESSDTDMSAYVRAADAIRETFDCSVMIVHHCGINDNRPRGHTSLTGAADAQLAVTRDGDNVFVKVEFMKVGQEGETIASRFEQVEVGTDEDGEPITSGVVTPSGLRRQRRARASVRARRLPSPPSKRQW
jgi:hypothetical protein